MRILWFSQLLPRLVPHMSSTSWTSHLALRLAPSHLKQKPHENCPGGGGAIPASSCCSLPGNKHSVRRGRLNLRGLSEENGLVRYCCSHTRHVNDRLKLIHVVICESEARPPPHLLCGTETRLGAKIALLHFRWEYLLWDNVWKSKCNSQASWIGIDSQQQHSVYRRGCEELCDRLLSALKRWNW